MIQLEESTSPEQKLNRYIAYSPCHICVFIIDLSAHRMLRQVNYFKSIEFLLTLLLCDQCYERSIYVCMQSDDYVME